MKHLASKILPLSKISLQHFEDSDTLFLMKARVLLPPALSVFSKLPLKHQYHYCQQTTSCSGSVMLQSSHTWTHSSSALEAELLKEAMTSLLLLKAFVGAERGGHCTHPSVATTSEVSCDTNAAVKPFFPASLHNV